MRKPRIAMKLGPKDYDGLVVMTNAVIAALTGNLHYLTPAVPLATLQAAKMELVTALAKWRMGNYGSFTELTDLRGKAITVHRLLTAESKYVALMAEIEAGNDNATMRTIMSTGGFPLMDDPNPQGVLEMVQNLHHFVSRSLNAHQVKLKWARPLNVTTRTNVKDYVVLRSNNQDLSAAVEIGQTTRTSYIDVNTTGTVQTWTYWVIAVNGFGRGAVSDPITVRVLPL